MPPHTVERAPRFVLGHEGPCVRSEFLTKGDSEQMDYSPYRLTFQDTSSFRAWYTRRRERTDGSPAAETTQRDKGRWVVRAANCAQTVFSPTTDAATAEQVLRHLAWVLEDRERSALLLDNLAENVTAGTVRNIGFALRDFGEYARVLGWSRGAALQVREDLPKAPPPPPLVVYSQSQLSDFTQAAKGRDLRFWAFICVLVDTGRRVGEVLGVKFSDLRLDMQPPYIELSHTKNGDPQYVPLSRRLVTEVLTPDHLDRLRRERRVGARRFRRDQEVFLFPFSYEVAKYRFRTLCQITGLPDYGFHRFRHSWVTHRLAAGVPIHAVSVLVGHRSVQTTERRYSHVTALDFAQYTDLC